MAYELNSKVDYCREFIQDRMNDLMSDLLIDTPEDLMTFAVAFLTESIAMVKEHICMEDDRATIAFINQVMDDYQDNTE